MKFLLLTLITHTDPARSAARRLREVVDTAVLAEEVGFDGFYRERWIFHGHDPAEVHVGAGSAGFYVARTAQEAIDTYRTIFENRLAAFRRVGVEPVFPTLEDAIERSSLLVGSPQQLIDKIHRYHERLGHEVMHLHADADGLTDKQHRAALELFQSEVAPAVRPLEGR